MTSKIYVCFKCYFTQRCVVKSIHLYTFIVFLLFVSELIRQRGHFIHVHSRVKSVWYVVNIYHHLQQELGSLLVPASVDLAFGRTLSHLPFAVCCQLFGGVINWMSL